MSQNRVRCAAIEISGTDFGISQLFIIRFSNGFQHCDGDSISRHVMEPNILSSIVLYAIAVIKNRRRTEKYSILGNRLATLLQFLRSDLGLR